MLRTSLILLAFSIASHYCAIIPEIPNSGNVGFRVDYDRRNAQFGEGIRDWFKNIKNKLGFGKKDTSKQEETPSPANQPLEPVLERVVIQPGNFFVDLSNLKFDPDRDWGFRVSNWYIIRKAPTTEQSFVSKPIEEWTNWNEFASADPLQNVIKHGPRDKPEHKTTESSDLITTLTTLTTTVPRTMMSTTPTTMVPWTTRPSTPTTMVPRTTMPTLRTTMAAYPTTMVPRFTPPTTTTSRPEMETMKKEKVTSGEKKASNENTVVVMPARDLSVEILTPTA